MANIDDLYQTGVYQMYIEEWSNVSTQGATGSHGSMGATGSVQGSTGPIGPEGLGLVYTGVDMNSKEDMYYMKTKWESIQEAAKDRIIVKEWEESQRRQVLTEQFKKSSRSKAKLSSSDMELFEKALSDKNGEVDRELLAEFERIAEADRQSRKIKPSDKPAVSRDLFIQTINTFTNRSHNIDKTQTFTEMARPEVSIPRKSMASRIKETITGIIPNPAKVPGISVIFGAIDETKTIIKAAKEEKANELKPVEPQQVTEVIEEQQVTEVIEEQQVTEPVVETPKTE